MAQPNKAAPDWERIEADYRAGVLSVREIAAAQGISHTAINKRAKAEGWERDLSKRIQAKADALVSRREVSSAVSTETSIPDRVIVEANAEVIARIRLAHRGDIARSRKVAMSLLDELEQQTGNLDLFEQLGELLRSPDDKGIDKLNDLYQKVISTPTRIDGMKKLAETLKTLIGLEREAYNIGPDGGSGGSNGAPLAGATDAIEAAKIYAQLMNT
ncbi:TPA: hypothetical protein SAO13_003744 [Burkholderia multivorans]|uniref:hypothetical protein n=1 Tax=Burkholderia multivorans TaxID=87883 RepID=UPI001C24519D|nr:hypothetical protein [Burkholderia multivorans]MBU9240982.1 hypothetical protein [Burkholderia multivorans]HEF4749739.1 hypothetical protein [Burkholderia multivorans]